MSADALRVAVTDVLDREGGLFLHAGHIRRQVARRNPGRFNVQLESFEKLLYQLAAEGSVEVMEPLYFRKRAP